jgi:FHS family L-fucose permease-like MFS transporter
MFRLSIGTYFIGGFVVSLVSLLVPRLKLLMGLDYTQSALVQLAFHSSYLLFAIPITAWLVGIGYMRGMAIGIAVMAAGCLGFVFAAGLQSFAFVLVALLALAGGITFLQIAGNIVIAVVEPEERAVSRMTLLQGFNSIGTVLAPLVGASFLLSDRSIGGDTRAWLMLTVPFIASMVVLVALAIAFARNRDLLAGVAPPRRVPLAAVRRVLATPRLLGGSLAMFGYVGAEVTIGTLLTNYLVLPDIIGVTPVTAGRLVSLYWAGAMIGRFAGAFVLTRWPPPRVLAAAAAAAMVLVAMAVGAHGIVGAVALIAVGLCNSIMYPTLFALSLPDDASAAPYASMVLCMAVVGGAVVPMLTAAFADVAGLPLSLTLPGICYAGIGLFALARAGYWLKGARGMA